MSNNTYLSHDELIKALILRGITVTPETPYILMRESYYAIVNGYKDSFLDKGATAGVGDDRYVSGTSFEDIYDLFSFDRELRSLAFRYIIRAEMMLKSITVNQFCRAYNSQGNGCYLDRANYATYDQVSGRCKRDYSTHLKQLMGMLKNKGTNPDSCKIYINHHVKLYSIAPLWVLANDLTFGTSSIFYALQKQGIKDAICIELRILFEHYHQGQSHRFKPGELALIFEVLSKFRNICAHDERIINVKSGSRYQYGLIDVWNNLRLLLAPIEYDELRREYADLLGKYERLSVKLNTGGVSLPPGPE